MDDGLLFRMALTAVIGGAAVVIWIGVALVMRGMLADRQRGVVKTSDFVVLTFLILLALLLTMGTAAAATVDRIGIYGP